MKTIYFEEAVVGEDSILHYQTKSLDLDVEGDMLINEHEVEKEACLLGQKLILYGDLFANLRAQLARVEDNLKRTAATVAHAFRHKMATAGQKHTEAMVQEHILLHEDFIRAQNILHWTRLNANLAEAWWRTCQQKADLLKLIGYRQNTELKKIPSL